MSLQQQPVIVRQTQLFLAKLKQPLVTQPLVQPEQAQQLVRQVLAR